ncbi:MAG: hypothetical protein IJ313_01315 [Clostridia bacterium]|nr:hypothetical protein [Clostridia bacterium]
MKITRIKALCKEADRAMIYNHHGRQYLGMLEAIYPADNIEISKASIPTLFDMPDALNDLIVDEMVLEGSDLMPVAGFESVPFNELGKLFETMAVNYLGAQLVGMTCGPDILFVQEKYLGAAEKTEGYQMYHLVHNEKGEPLVMISDGMMITGIVRPITRRTVQSILEMMRGMINQQPCGSPDPGMRQEADDQLPGQMHMDDVVEEGEDGKES